LQYAVCKKRNKKKKCFLFLAVYFCPSSVSDDDKDSKTQKALKQVSARVLMYKKREKVHMKCTHLQSKTGLHCKTSEKAHGDRPPELFS